MYKMLFINFFNWYLLAQMFELIIVIADLFYRLDTYIAYNMSFPTILLFTLLLIPKGFGLRAICDYVWHVWLLVLFINNELIAIFTQVCNISIPIVIIFSIFSLLMIFIDSYGATCNALSDNLYHQLLMHEMMIFYYYH